MTEKKNILSEKLASIDHQLPTEDLWSKLEQELPKPRRKRRYIIWLVIAGCIVGSSALWLTPASDMSKLAATQLQVPSDPQPNPAAVSQTLTDNESSSNSQRKNIDNIEASEEGNQPATKATRTVSRSATNSSVTEEARKATYLGTLVTSPEKETDNTTASQAPMKATLEQSQIADAQYNNQNQQPKAIIQASEQMTIVNKSALGEGPSVAIAPSLLERRPVSTEQSFGVRAASAGIVKIERLAVSKLYTAHTPPSDAIAHLLTLPAAQYQRWSIDIAGGYGRSLSNPSPLADSTATFKHVDVWSASIGVSYALGQRYGLRADLYYSTLTDVNQIDLVGGDELSALGDGGFASTQLIDRYTIYDKYKSIGLGLSAYYELPLSQSISLRPEVGVRYQRMVTYPQLDQPSPNNTITKQLDQYLDRENTIDNLRTAYLGIEAGLHINYQTSNRSSISIGAVYNNLGTMAETREYRRQYHTVQGQARFSYRF